MDRRQAIGALAGFITAPAFAQTPAMTKITAYAFNFPALDGSNIRLSEFSGKPILVVNTASHCGYTPQFTGLQELWSKFHDRGLMIVGVPSNDFGGQEPGGAKEIAATAHSEYGVTFPMAAKTEVKGPRAHPFFKWVASERPQDIPKWNFHKYLVGRDGRLAAAFTSTVEPNDTRVITAIAKELTG